MILFALIYTNFINFTLISKKIRRFKHRCDTYNTSVIQGVGTGSERWATLPLIVENGEENILITFYTFTFINS